MAEAIFALVGVIVGGLIAAGTTYWMERKRQDREGQAAARQVFVHLYIISSICDALSKVSVQETHDLLKEIEIHLEPYRDHQATFAVHLRILQYLDVAAAVGQLQVQRAVAPASCACGQR